ncbi:MAG: hypothetical protein RL557_235 [archaeon]|jgi:CDP-6-deoxy-D-xylo-4-hexulose-3-dehydrase
METRSEKVARVISEIKATLHDYFKELPSESRYKVPLISRLYDEEEVVEVIESLLHPERLTLNAGGDLKTIRFENIWSEFIGVKNGIMVNSGSSANLITYYVLSNPSFRERLYPGDEVITTALTWGTSVTPLFALGLKPVFVDVNPESYTIDVTKIEEAITPRTRAIMPVHLLGFSADMDEIMRLAKKYNLLVIEDCCEAHGAEWNGSKVGSFGHFSTFSFYLSHHITTIEGGMILTNNDSYAELARIIRSQGVMRNVKNPEYKAAIQTLYPDIDPRFLFANTGYNFRPTEMESSFGIVQWKRFDAFLKIRELNANFLTEKLSQYNEFIQLPKKPQHSKAAWFSYPILVKKSAPFSKEELVQFLEEKGIETRPVMSGNFTKHPVAKLYDFRISKNMAYTDAIHEQAFLIGTHAGIGEAEREYIAACFNDFFEFIKKRYNL